MNVHLSGNQQRRERIWLWLIVLGALGLRVALALLPRVIRWDEPDYLWLGRNLWTGGGYTIVGVPELHYTPLLPILAGAIYVLTGNPELGTAFWYVVLGALVILPIHALARRIYGRQVALLAAILVAVFPGLSSAVLYWGTMTEPLFVFLLYCALWAAGVAVDERKTWAYGAAGAFLSLAYLSRPEGIVWFLAIGIFLAIVWLFRRQIFRLRTLAQAALYVGLFVVLAAPYALYMYRQTGRWMATGKLSITYDIGEAVLERDPVLYDKVTASLDPTSGEILWWSESRFERSILDILIQDPLSFVRRGGRNLRQLVVAFLNPAIVPSFLVVPIILGWFRYPWNRRRLRNEGLLWFGALPAMAFLPFHVEIRFFSPLFPVVVIWIAAGLEVMGLWVAESLAHWRERQDAAHRGMALAHRQPAPSPIQFIAATVMLMVLLLYFGWMHVRTVRTGMRDLAYAHKMAGLWIKAHTPAEAAVMSRDLAVSLYAERGFVVSPRAEYGAYLQYARRKGAKYVLVDEREVRVLRPHLSFLLDEANPPPELEAVYSAKDDRGQTIVYRIKDIADDK